MPLLCSIYIYFAKQWPVSLFSSLLAALLSGSHLIGKSYDFSANKTIANLDTVLTIQANVPS
jgi:hypothetical protein